MAKKKKSTAGSKSEVKKKISKHSENVFDQEWFHVIRVVLIVLGFLGIFYLLTVYIINRNQTDTGSSKEEVSIQYDEILVGTSFDMKDSEYLVLYYDKSDEDLSKSFSDKLSSYQSMEEALKVYTTDLGSAFNQSYVTTGVVNRNPNDASELRFSGPTLIKFADGKVIDYIEGENSILEYLS